MGSAKTPEDVSIDFSLDGKTTKRSLASPIKIPAWQDDLKAHSLQLRVLPLGLLQDGDVGVGVFPEGKEILISGACLCVVTQELVPACLADIGQRNKWIVRMVAVQISNMLKVLNGFLRFAGFKIAGGAHREQKYPGGIIDGSGP